MLFKKGIISMDNKGLTRRNAIKIKKSTLPTSTNSGVQISNYNNQNPDVGNSPPKGILKTPGNNNKVKRNIKFSASTKPGTSYSLKNKPDQNLKQNKPVGLALLVDENGRFFMHPDVTTADVTPFVKDHNRVRRPKKRRNRNRNLDDDN